jgi:ribonuclease BN (tRNA processing enzyme)
VEGGYNRRMPYRNLALAALAAALSASALVAQASKPAAEPSAQDPTGTPAAHAPASRTRVVLLGTGTPNAEPDRSGPALAIVVDETPYVVDAGPGIVRRASAAYRKGIRALEPKRLRLAFLTHLHSDHTAGYPDLILTPAVLERNAPLVVYGPKGTRDMTANILRAWSADIDLRTHDLEPSKPAGYEVRAADVEPGPIFSDARVSVSAIPVRHGAWKSAFAYRFATPDRTIVVSGDTAPADTIVAACNGCDILVHEVYSTAGFATRPPEWQRYHRAYHTSSAELAALASRARPKLLVLTHQLYWGVTDEALLAEIRQAYAGKVVSGRDLDVF